MEVGKLKGEMEKVVMGSKEGKDKRTEGDRGEC